VDKRFETFSTKELTTLYQALIMEEAHAMREQILKVLVHRKVVMDKIFGLTQEELADEKASAQSAGFRAYWAGASDAEAAACDLEEI
jgi:hypothetical protein